MKYAALALTIVRALMPELSSTVLAFQTVNGRIREEATLVWEDIVLF